METIQDKVPGWKDRFSWLYGLLDSPILYALSQCVGKPTKRRYTAVLERSMPNLDGARVLEIGCGVGRGVAPHSGLYFGVDLNPRNVARASIADDGAFAAMDGTKLGFADGSFDQVVSVAVTHHLDDAELRAMVGEALRVCRPGGQVHIVDAILPVSPIRTFKKFWFSIDRGRYPRSLQCLADAIGHAETTETGTVCTGPLHDVVCFRLTADTSARRQA